MAYNAYDPNKLQFDLEIIIYSSLLICNLII